MAKDYNKKKVPESKEVKKVKGVVTTLPYTTSTGKKIVLHGLPPMMVERLQAQYDARKPKIPTYIIIDIAGTEEIHDHNITTLEVEGDPVETEKNKKLWDEYVKGTAAIDKESSEAMMRMIMLRGVYVSDYDENGSWIDEQEFLGLTIPSDTSARRYHYVQTEIIGDANDLNTIMTIVMKLSGIPEEYLREAEHLFQSAMEEAASQGFDSTG